MKNGLLLIFAFVWITFASCTKEAAGFFAPLSGKGGSMARFTIVDDYLYTVDKAQLKVYNLSNGDDPVLKSTTEAGFEIETIFPFKDKLFLGSTSVVYIFSISDPEHPEKLSTAQSKQVIRRCDPVVAKDSVAFATLKSSSPCGGQSSILAVYDISNVLKPVERASYPLVEPNGLGYADSALYVCDGSILKVFNITDPFLPTLVNSIQNELFIDVIPTNNTLICWTIDGVTLYDISKRFQPELIRKII